MARNYFKAICEWEEYYIIRNSHSSTELQKNVILRLKKFITDGKYSSSKAVKFYGKYYNKSYSQLADLWKKEFGTNKSEDTIRGQRGAFSRQLVDLFGSIDSIDVALRNVSKFSSNASDEEQLNAKKYLSDLLLRLNAFEQVDDVTGNISLAVDIGKFLDSDDSVNEYDIADCTTEIKLLKALSEDGIKELFGVVDKDKLNYLLRVLNQPLLKVETREYEKNGRDMVAYSKSANIQKIKLLEEFDVIKPVKLKVPKKKNTYIEAEVDLPSTDENSESDYVLGLPFRFDEMKDLCSVISDKINSSSELTKDAEEFKRYKRNLEILFSFFTVDGLKAYLSRFKGGDVADVIRKYIKS